MANPYDDAFYEGQSLASVASARRVLPVLFDTLSVKSVVDVGCGVGSWLKVCRDLGATDVLGLDGDYVDRKRLMFPVERFRPTDLAADWSVERRLDLAISLEVAEHLPPEAAPEFVGKLTRLADVVLFSAAIPYQGGTGHQNESWQEFWADAFKAHGYTLFDLIRPRFWHDDAVEYWYRQNMFVFAKTGSAAEAQLKAVAGPSMPLSIVHPEAYLYAVSRGTILSRDRVGRDIDRWRAGARVDRAKTVYPLNGHPWLGLKQALKNVVKAAIRGTAQ